MSPVTGAAVSAVEMEASGNVLPLLHLNMKTHHTDDYVFCTVFNQPHVTNPQ